MNDEIFWTNIRAIVTKLLTALVVIVTISAITTVYTSRLELREKEQEFERKLKQTEKRNETMQKAIPWVH